MFLIQFVYREAFALSQGVYAQVFYSGCEQGCRFVFCFDAIAFGPKPAESILQGIGGFIIVAQHGSGHAVQPSLQALERRQNGGDVCVVLLLHFLLFLFR